MLKISKRFSYKNEVNRYNKLHDDWEHNMENFNNNLKKLQKLKKKWNRDSNKYLHLWDYFYRLYDECDETIDIEKKKLLQIKMHQISNKMARTVKENELLDFEVGLILAYEDFYCKNINDAMNKMEHFHFITNENSKVKTITKAKARQIEKETCCICLDCHKICQVITTQCGHIFGKRCFERIIEDNGDNASCPYCRKRDLQFTLYRKR